MPRSSPAPSLELKALARGIHGGSIASAKENSSEFFTAEVSFEKGLDTSSNEATCGANVRTGLKKLIPALLVLVSFLIHVVLGPLHLKLIFTNKRQCLGSGADYVRGPYSSYVTAFTLFSIHSAVVYFAGLFCCTVLKKKRFRVAWGAACLLIPFIIPAVQLIGNVEESRTYATVCAPNITYAVKTPIGDHGCSRIDVSKLHPFWVEACNISHLESVFVYSGVEEKYAIDLNFIGSAMQLIRPVLNNFAREILETKLIESAMCATILTPCDAQCKPMAPCNDYVESFMLRVADIYNDDSLRAIAKVDDCRSLGQAFDFSMLNFAGFSDSFIEFAEDLLNGIQNSCKTPEERLVAGLNFDPSQVCNHFLNSSSVYNAGSKSGDCTQTKWNAFVAEKNKALEMKKASERKWEKTMILILTVSYGLMLLLCAWAAFASKGGSSCRISSFSDITDFRSRSFPCIILLFLDSWAIAVAAIRYMLPVYFGSTGFLYAIICCALAAMSLSLFLLLDAKVKWRERDASLLVKRASSASSETIFVKLSSTKFIQTVIRLRKAYRDRFTVGGTHYMIKAAVLEIVEITIQSSALLANFRELDITLILVLSIVIFLNAIVSPIFFWRKNRDGVIAFDASLDLAYTIINTYALIQADRRPVMTFAAVLSLLFPIASIIDLLYSYANFILRTENLKIKGNLEHQKSILGLPKSSIDSEGSRRAKVAFDILRMLYTVLCVFSGGFSATLFSRALARHSLCLQHAPSCIWRSASPRLYFPEGLFGATSCGVENVSRVTATECGSLRKVDFSRFKGLAELSLGKMDSFPRSVTSLVRDKDVNLKLACLPRLWDMSHLHLQSIPAPILDTFRGTLKHCPATNALPPTINVSSNFLDYASLVALSRSVSCDGERHSSCNIQVVDFSFNKASLIPVRFFNNADDAFPSLRNIYASDNKLTVYSFNMGRFHLLPSRNLFVARNPFTTVAFSGNDLGNFDALMNLDISTDLVTTLSMNECRLGEQEGEDVVLPSWLPARFPKLVNLLLNNNRIRGTIPSEYGNLKHLVTVYLSGNELTGDISPFCNLSKLTNAFLYVNNFTGTIPACLSKCTNLAKLDLGENDLRGSIPSEFRELRSLRALMLHKNPRADWAFPVANLTKAINATEANASIPCDVLRLAEGVQRGGSLAILTVSPTNRNHNNVISHTPVNNETIGTLCPPNS